MTGLAGCKHRGDGVIDAQELVILADNLDQAGLVLGEQCEVFDQVQQPHLFACAANHYFQCHAAWLIFAFDAFPFEQPLPIRR